MRTDEIKARLVGVWKAARRHKAYVVAAAILGALSFLGDFQTGQQIAGWGWGEMTTAFGPNWIPHFLGSWWWRSGCLLTALFLLWRLGGLQKKEEEAAAMRLFNRQDAHFAPLKGVLENFGRRQIVLSLRQFLATIQAQVKAHGEMIERCSVGGPHLWLDSSRHILHDPARLAIENAAQIQWWVGVAPPAPTLRYPSPEASIKEGSRHVQTASFDPAHNPVFLAAWRADLDDLRAYADAIEAALAKVENDLDVQAKKFGMKFGDTGP